MRHFRPRVVFVTREIPFNRPFIAGSEQKYIAEAIARGHISGDGYFSRLCENFLQEAIGAHRVMLTTSCTDALEMAALLLELRPGDEVILPSFTFVSTANAFVLYGARPVFVDIRPDTLNLDECLIESRIGPNSRAIVAVHYGGVACEMDAIGAIASQHGLVVIEDNAHGLFGRYRGRPLGSFGALATQSFHETKNFTCGEGGALVIGDPSLEERAEIFRHKGTDRARFSRGLVDKYTWVNRGSSFLPSDLLAAFLYGQLEHRQHIQERRAGIWRRYFSNLESWALSHDVQLPFVPSHCEQSYHLFFLLLNTESARDELLAHLEERGIGAVFHYQALHESKMGRRYESDPKACPVSSDVSRRLVRLPYYYGLERTDQDRVIEAVLAFRP